MLNELDGLQESDENVWSISMSFEVETRSEDGEELVHRTYRFGYAKEWDKWTFQEFQERRTLDKGLISDRNWQQSRHIMWHDVNETPTIEVPPEVADKLQEATGAESIVLQIPTGGIEENSIEEVYIADD